jgi:hypothetical protein
MERKFSNWNYKSDEENFIGLSPSITPFGKRKFICRINHTKTGFFVNVKTRL